MSTLQYINTYVLREIRSDERNSFITVIILSSILIVFFFAYAAFGREEKDETLVSVHILFRHGDRTPTFFFPTDPNGNKSWPDGAGELTNKGKYQMYMLGKWIRSRYSNFLPLLYSNKDLMVKSSYSARCQMSAATLLAGLYPPTGSQIWNDQLLWQPIPVNPIPRDSDNLIAAKASCSAFSEEKKKSDEELMNELTTDQKDIFDYTSKHTGLRITDIGSAESLYYTFSIEKDNGLKLPLWTDKIFPEPLKTIAALNLASYTRTEQLKRLQSGPLLGEWLSNLESSQRGNSPLLHLYSGHDLTIINTMRSLNLMKFPWLPEYGASLILELHKQTVKGEKSSFRVKFLYLNSSSAENALELKMPKCDLYCPIETFKAIIKSCIPNDWKKECDHLE